jgi:hypothetical protein
MNLDLMLCIYVLGAVAVGIYVFREELEPTFLIKKKDKRLGPSYWGVYEGSELEEQEAMRTIVPPKPCKDADGVAGSGMYSKGRAVKSAR